jgi:hypothetical protein
VTFRSRWISLAEHSRSSFALFVSVLCVGFFLSPGVAIGYSQWKVQILSAGIRTRARQAGSIRRLWRLLYGKVESGLMSNLELQGGSPRPCQLRTDRLAPMDKFEMCIDACRILWGPVNLVASVTTWSNCNRYSMVVVGGRMR